MRTVLVVDDQDMFRRVIGATLEHEGYTVQTADNGLEALIMVAKHRPDLVVLDLYMPVLNGWATLEALRKQPATEALPVIVLTMNDRIEDELAARQAGATAYLMKPVDPDLLTEVVRECLGEPRLRGQKR